MRYMTNIDVKIYWWTWKRTYLAFHINKVNLNTSVNRLYRKDKKISPFFIFPLSSWIPSKTQIYCFSDSQSPNQRRHYLSKHFNQYSWHANKQRKLYKFLRLLSSSLSPKHSISSSQTKSFYTIWMLSVYILGKFNVWAVDM